MKSNIGYIDKIVRVSVAAVALVFYFAHVASGSFDEILLIAATILLITAFINFCPIWHLFGITTRKKKFIKQQEKLN